MLLLFSTVDYSFSPSNIEFVLIFDYIIESGIFVALMLIHHKSDPDHMPPSELRSNTRTQSAINTYMFSHKAEIRQCNSVPEILFVCFFVLFLHITSHLHNGTGSCAVSDCYYATTVVLQSGHFD